MLRFRQVVSRLLSVPESRRASGGVPQVLAVMKPGPCSEALRAIFAEAGWVLEVVEEVRSVTDPGSGRVGATTCPMVLYEHDPSTSHWAADVFELSRMAHRPWVVLLSATPDKNLWDEACRDGAWDILRTPVRREDVLKVVRSGYSLWRNRQRLRDKREHKSSADGSTPGELPFA